jgi:hypothetical protein
MSVVRPIFRIFDYVKAIEFYVGWLEFKVDWEHQFDENSPKYLQISRQDIALHLSGHHGDCSSGARVLIEDFNGIRDYHAMLIRKDYKYNKPGIETAFWNSEILCMEVIDPFGNRLTFSGKTG